MQLSLFSPPSGAAQAANDSAFVVAHAAESGREGGTFPEDFAWVLQRCRATRYGRDLAGCQRWLGGASAFNGSYRRFQYGGEGNCPIAGPSQYGCEWLQ